MPFSSPANAPLPPRPSAEQVEHARILITRFHEFSHLPQAEREFLRWTAWNALRIDRLHRSAAHTLRRCRSLNGGDVA